MGIMHSFARSHRVKSGVGVGARYCYSLVLVNRS